MKKAPSPLVSLIPLVVLVIMLFATIRTFGRDALSGGSQVSLLTTTAVCILIGMGFYKIGWKDFELAITNNITGPNHSADYRRIERCMDDKRCGPHIDLLRSANHTSQFFPDLYLHYLCLGIGYDRKLLDYDCYHRNRFNGHWQSTGIRRRLDSRSHYFGRILRR